MKYLITMSDLMEQVRQKEIYLSEGKLNETGHEDVKSAKNQVQIAMSALQKMSGELSKLNDEDSLPTWWTNKVAVSVDKLDGMADYLDTQVEKAESRDPSKSGTGYDISHKDFSSAMQHAYDFAKRKFGITIDPSEIDKKVATGPRKPSKGETNTYRLKGKGGNIQIQVYNKGGSKPFELNMYKEEVDLDEDIMPLIFGGGIAAALLPVLFMSVREIIRGTPLESSIKKIVDKLKKNKNYKMSDSEKSDVEGFVSKVKKDKPSLLQKAMKNIKEEVELDEVSARRDAMIDMGKAKDKESDDVVATADDRKAADKNIIMQLRRLQDMGKGKAMFADKKTSNINPKLIDYALKMHGKMKPQDKLKFQKAISKSYKDFLMTLKRTR